MKKRKSKAVKVKNIIPLETFLARLCNLGEITPVEIADLRIYLRGQKALGPKADLSDYQIAFKKYKGK